MRNGTVRRTVSALFLMCSPHGKSFLIVDHLLATVGNESDAPKRMAFERKQASLHACLPASQPLRGHTTKFDLIELFEFWGSPFSFFFSQVLRCSCASSLVCATLCRPYVCTACILYVGG